MKLRNEVVQQCLYRSIEINSPSWLGTAVKNAARAHMPLRVLAGVGPPRAGSTTPHARLPRVPPRRCRGGCVCVLGVTCGAGVSPPVDEPGRLLLPSLFLLPPPPLRCLSSLRRTHARTVLRGWGFPSRPWCNVCSLPSFPFSACPLPHARSSVHSPRPLRSFVPAGEATGSPPPPQPPAPLPFLPPLLPRVVGGGIPSRPRSAMEPPPGVPPTALTMDAFSPPPAAAVPAPPLPPAAAAATAAAAAAAAAGAYTPPPVGAGLGTLPAVAPSPVDQMRALMAASGGPPYFPSPPAPGTSGPVGDSTGGGGGGGGGAGVSGGSVAAAAVAAVAAVAAAGEGGDLSGSGGSGGPHPNGEGGGGGGSGAGSGAPSLSTAGGGGGRAGGGAVGGGRARTDADRKSRERARVLRNRELARVSNERRKVRDCLRGGIGECGRRGGGWLRRLGERRMGGHAPHGV